MRRWLAHLTATQRRLKRHFTPEVCDAVEAAIHASEARHGGEIRFVVEAALDFDALAAGTSARARALELFAELGVWDTELNNGVLIYVLFAEHAIEIVADRGYTGRVAPEEWQAVCRAGEREFRAGRYGAGAVAMIEAVDGLIAPHFPRAGDDRDELANRPTLI